MRELNWHHFSLIFSIINSWYRNLSIEQVKPIKKRKKKDPTAVNTELNAKVKRKSSLKKVHFEGEPLNEVQLLNIIRFEDLTPGISFSPKHQFDVRNTTDFVYYYINTAPHTLYLTECGRYCSLRAISRVWGNWKCCRKCSEYDLVITGTTHTGACVTCVTSATSVTSVISVTPVTSAHF